MKTIHQLLILFITVTSFILMDIHLLNGSTLHLKYAAHTGSIKKSAVMSGLAHFEKNSYSINADTSIVFDSEYPGDGSFIREVRPYDYQFYPRNNYNLANVVMSGLISGSRSFTLKVVKRDFNFRKKSPKSSMSADFYAVESDDNGHFYIKVLAY